MKEKSCCANKENGSSQERVRDFIGHAAVYVILILVIIHALTHVFAAYALANNALNNEPPNEEVSFTLELILATLVIFAMGIDVFLHRRHHKQHTRMHELEQENQRLKKELTKKKSITKRSS